MAKCRPFEIVGLAHNWKILQMKIELQSRWIFNGTIKSVITQPRLVFLYFYIFMEDLSNTTKYSRVLYKRNVGLWAEWVLIFSFSPHYFSRCLLVFLI